MPIQQGSIILASDMQSSMFSLGSIIQTRAKNLPGGSDKWAPCDGRILYPDEFDSNLLNSQNYVQDHAMAVPTVPSAKRYFKRPDNTYGYYLCGQNQRIKYLINKKPEAIVWDTPGQNAYVINLKTGVRISGTITASNFGASVDCGFDGSKYYKLEVSCTSSGSTGTVTIKKYTTNNISASAVSWTLNTTWSQSSSDYYNKSPYQVYSNGTFIIFSLYTAYSTYDTKCYFLKTIGTQTPTVIQQGGTDYIITGYRTYFCDNIFPLFTVSGTFSGIFAIISNSGAITYTTFLSSYLSYLIDFAYPYNSNVYLFSVRYLYESSNIYGVYFGIYNKSTNFFKIAPNSAFTSLMKKGNDFYADGLYKITIPSTNNNITIASSATTVSNYDWHIPMLWINTSYYNQPYFTKNILDENDAMLSCTGLCSPYMTQFLENQQEPSETLVKTFLTPVISVENTIHYIKVK